MPTPPCWDPQTRSDCPFRSVLCHVNCAKWQMYEREKTEYYAKQAKEREKKRNILEYQNNIINKIRRSLNKK